MTLDPDSHPAQPPEAARKPHQFTHHGITVQDPWAWLRDPAYPTVEDPEVLAYLEAENAWFEASMAPLQTHVQGLFEEMKARQPREDASVPYAKNGFWYQWRYLPEAQYRTWCRAPVTGDEWPATDAAGWDILLDEPALAADHDYFRLGGMSVSPDNRYLAYSVDTDGSERFELSIVDLASGAAVGEPLPNTIDSPVWEADGAGVYYVVVSEEWRPWQVWYRALDATQSHLVYEESDSGYFVHLGLTQSERYITISSGSHTENEVWLLTRSGPPGTPRVLTPRRAGHEYYVDHRAQGDEFIIRSNRRHTNFDLYRASGDAVDESTWTLAVEGDAQRYITGHLALDSHTVVEERLDGLDQIRLVQTHAPFDDHGIEFPEATYSAGLGTNPNPDARQLRISYNSMVTPPTVYDYDIATRTLITRKVQAIPSGYDAEDFVTQRLSVPARDGAQVPVSLVRHRDTPLDGTAPLYLYGYGAYGLAIPPGFSTTRISLLERGFVYAIAHIRGGDDLGYDWYTAGKLQARTNTFNDFVDCARYLVEHNYTRVGRIAIAGGSAGGELMGAVVNQAPELWGAVVAHVPFVDVLNTMLDDTLPLTPLEWPEWGNPIEDAQAFELIRSYSPYDQLEPRDYPPMLVTAGLQDPRVTYWEPAKYVAKLRSLKTDDNVLLLKTNMGAGHSGQSGRFDSLQEVAEEYAFVMRELAIAGLEETQ